MNTPGRDRTCDLSFRKAPLYPTELREHNARRGLTATPRTPVIVRLPTPANKKCCRRPDQPEIRQPEAGRRPPGARCGLADSGWTLWAVGLPTAGCWSRDELCVRAVPTGSDRGQPADAAAPLRPSASSPADQSPGNARSSPSRP